MLRAADAVARYPWRSPPRTGNVAGGLPHHARVGPDGAGTSGRRGRDRHPRAAEPDSRLRRARLRDGRRIPRSSRRCHGGVLEPGGPQLPACARAVVRGRLQQLHDHPEPRQRQPEGQLGRLRRVHVARRRGRDPRRRSAQLPARHLVRRHAPRRPVRAALRQRRKPDRYAAAARGRRREQRRLRRGRAGHGPAPQPSRPRGLHREPLGERLPAEPRAEHLQPSHQPASPALRSGLQAQRLELQLRIDRLAGRVAQPGRRLQDPVHRQRGRQPLAPRLLRLGGNAQRGHDQFLLERVRAARLPVLVRLRHLVAAARTR